MPDLQATGALPPDDTPRDLEADLEAEFADHLALVARDEMLRGRSAEEAQEKASERFGDFDKIQKQCRWVHQGDAVMLRTVMIGGLVVLALALGYSTWTSRQGQADLRQRLAEVTAKLEAMAETQPPPTTGTISGVAYLGDKSKPAAGVEIQLLKAPPRELGRSREPTPDWVVERTFITDATGNYTFEALAPGTYSLMAYLFDPDLTKQRWGQVQSRPTGIGPGAALDIPLDVRLRTGTVRIALSRPLPGPFKVGDHELRLSIHGHILQRSRIPVPSDGWHNSTDQWPKRGFTSRSTSGFRQSFHFVPERGFRIGTLPSARGRPTNARNAMQRIEYETLGEPSEPATIFSDPNYHSPIGEERDWIEGDYLIEVMLYVIDSAGQIACLEDVNARDLAHEDIVPVRSRAAFSVMENLPTDLRIMVPDGLEHVGTALAEFQNQVLSDTYFEETIARGHSVGLMTGVMRLKPRRLKDFAKLLDHTIEIEVTERNPAK